MYEYLVIFIMVDRLSRKAEVEKRQMDERIDQIRLDIEKKKKEEVLHRSTSASNVITSLDGTSVKFSPNADGIKREGNTLTNTSGLNRNCFIGGEMRSV